MTRRSPGRPRLGTAGDEPASPDEGPQRPLAARTRRLRTCRAYRFPSPRALSPRAQGHPAAGQTTTTTHDSFQLLLFSL